MEKNSLDRVKLMMGYDLSKTLNENTSEMGIKGDVEEAGFKSVEKAMKSGTDLKKLYAELGTAFKVSEDVVRLAAAKDLTTLTKELKSAVTKDLKSGFRSGGSSLGSLTKNASKSKTIHEILNAGKPLNENEIIAIIERNKSQAKDLIVKAEQGGKTVSKTASTTTKTVAKDVAAAEKEVKAAVVDVKTSVEASKVIDQTVVAVTKKGPRLAARLRKAKMTISKYSPKFWGKLSSVRSKLSLKNLLLFGLAGYGLYELMKGWFTDGEDGGGETGGVFPPCVTNLDDYKIVTTSNGDPVIVAFNPGEQTEVKFYTNGRVWTKSNDKKGRYSCKSDTELNEQPDSVMDRRIGIDTPSTNNKNTSKVSTNNFSNISIVWDGDKVNPSPDPDVTPVPSPPEMSMYTPCPSFPMVYGCKSDEIREVQSCLGFEQKYQTGNFGPITMKGLGGLKELTKEKYDEIIAKCKTENKPVIKTGNTQTTTTGTTKTDTTKTIPTEPTVKSTETTKGETPADLYARLVKDGSLRGRLRGQRIVYKGPDLSKEEQEKLGQYMADQGYRLSRSNFDKKFGDKYVYKKNKPEEETK
jgi:hypothetical protein